MTAEDIVRSLQLQPHPEGGYYKENYRSNVRISKVALPKEFGGERDLATAIYFLIEKNNFSALHRIKSDETWHFYDGNALEVIEITPDGNLIKTQIGKNLINGEVFQYTVKAGNWFGSRVLKGGEFSLVGCTVYPGFDFKDFEMAKRNYLMTIFPHLKEIIEEMTRS